MWENFPREMGGQQRAKGELFPYLLGKLEGRSRGGEAMTSKRP